MHLLNLALALFSASVVASSGAVEYPQCDGGGKLHVCCNAGSEYRSVQCYDCDAGMVSTATLVSLSARLGEAGRALTIYCRSWIAPVNMLIAAELRRKPMPSECSEVGGMIEVVGTRQALNMYLFPVPDSSTLPNLTLMSVRKTHSPHQAFL